MSYVFGIDLGTTYSCVAYIDEYGKPMVLKNSDGDHTTPSVVMVETAKNIIVGTEAKRSIKLEPDKTVQFIKRKMGKEEDSVTLNGIDYHAPEISSMILKKLVSDANEELRQIGVLKDGEEVKDVVITCPAYWGFNERHATKIAGELIGLNVLDVINEPTAAAISYGISGVDKNETVLVYDLGGGTFDITVMNIDGGNISVVCTGGDEKLGGKDWDDKLMNYVVGCYEGEFGEDLSEDPEITAALYVDVETWKKSLTSREKVNISVNGPAGRFREELTRVKYEEITSSLLNRTKNLLNDVLSTAEKKGYPLSKIDKVLLVGGSSRMPQVAAMIKKDYGLTPMLADPDEAVAKGAAIFACNKAYKNFLDNQPKGPGICSDPIPPMGPGVNITNVLSKTYGFSAYDVSNGDILRIFNMIMINDKLPASHTETFVTRYDNQTSCDLSVYESVSNDTVIDMDGREPVVVAEMKFKSSVPKGTPVIQTLTVDNSGCLHIIAEEQLNHTKLETKFQLSNQMSDADRKAAEIRMGDAKVE